LARSTSCVRRVKKLMSSSRLVALVVLLGASTAVSAAEQPATERHLDLTAPSIADLYLEAPAGATPDNMLGERNLDASRDGLTSRPGEGSVSPLKVRLGRTPAAGRSPGDAPPLYGEVGIDLDSGAGLSLVPSYRVVLPDNDEAAESEASAAQVLKLGARIRF
jgi:hypothetical protein